MAISNIVNATRRFLNLRSGAQGNNALATLGALNNLVEQINLANANTIVFYKYESGVDTLGTPFQILKATNIINGFIPESNPANKISNPCDACTNCKTGPISWTGKPCWKLVGGSSSSGCVECARAIEDLSDGVYNGLAARLIKLPPKIGVLDSNGSGNTFLEATHLPPKITVSFSEDPTNAATGANNWYFVMWNTETGTVDYTDIAQVVFKITYFDFVEGFVTPQGPQ